jgi:hypothetical protein
MATREEILKPELPPCKAVQREKARLERLRDPRYKLTAKERLDKAHQEIARAMSEGQGRKVSRRRRAQLYEMQVSVGEQARLPETEEPLVSYGINPGPGRCCPDAHYVNGRCTGCGHEEKVK